MGEHFATIGDKEFALWVVSGMVKAVESSSETVYSQQYSALARGCYIDSQAVSDTRIYFVDTGGQERLAGVGKGFPVREGHQVKVLYCAPKGERDGYPIAILNEALSQRVLIDPNAFNDRYKAISTAWLNARLGLGCLTTVALLTATLVLPVYLSKDAYFRTFGVAFLVVLAYMMYEGGLGIRIWSWRRIRRLEKALNVAVSGHFSNEDGKSRLKT